MTEIDPHAGYLHSRPIDSLTSYLREIRRLTNPWFAEAGGHLRPWFRGHVEGQWPLLPNVYRPEYRDFSEQRCRVDFKLRALPYISDLPKEPQDEWDWYFIMQHHGLPTRLLDWSENPLVALYFALRRAPGKVRPAVWMLNPSKLNMLVAGARDVVLLHTDPIARAYLPDTEHALPRDPIAIQPPHNSRRLMAQKGAFTIHGRDQEPLDSYTSLRGHLIKFEIRCGAISSIRKDLTGTGMTEAHVFPELPSLCEELKEHWKESGATSPGDGGSAVVVG